MAEPAPAGERTLPAPPLRGGFVANVVPALVWAIAIFIGGSSGVPQPKIDVGLPTDKVNHLVAFCGMQLLAYRALRYALPDRTRPPLRWLAALAATLVGVLLELYQLGLPDRSAEVADVVADGIGATVGAVALTLLSRTWPRPHARGARDT
ncbi:MAG TPA: VanZ family protein [Polyangiaceae bacterium]|nr:VanZ family protein [Polyangiaceae bacterium]